MTSKKDDDTEAIPIESTMKSIELLLKKLESSDTPLDESLEAFQEGMLLIRSAQKTLADAEQKVQTLLESDKEPVASDFPADGEADS